jgi:hypothetical protein
MKRHRVSDWAPIHMEQMSQFCSILTTSSKYQRPIKELADSYVLVERLGMEKMGTQRNVSLLLKRTIGKSIAYLLFHQQGLAGKKSRFWLRFRLRCMVLF